MHCANMSYMYHCLRYSYYRQKLLTKESTSKDLFASKDQSFFSNVIGTSYLLC